MKQKLQAQGSTSANKRDEYLAFALLFAKMVELKKR